MQTPESASATPNPPPTETSTTNPDITHTISDSYSALMRGELTDASSTLIMKVAVPAVIALIMLIVAYFVASMVSRWVSNLLCKRVDKTLGKFGGRLTFYAIMLISGIAVLQTMGVGVTSFAAILGAAGFAVGLAFQGTLGNFASGVLLLVFRPFKVGDVVNTASVLGKVNAIDLFTTTFDTPDNRRIIVPNSAITGATIENISFHTERRVDVAVGVEYSASLDTTREVLTDCAEALADLTIQGEGRGYQIVLTNLGASSVDWVVRLWTKSDNYFLVKEILTEEIKNQLDAHRIGIPFPQMELHIADPDVSSSPSDLTQPEPIQRVDNAELGVPTSLTSFGETHPDQIQADATTRSRTARPRLRPRTRA